MVHERRHPIRPHLQILTDHQVALRDEQPGDIRPDLDGAPDIVVLRTVAVQLPLGCRAEFPRVYPAPAPRAGASYLFQQRLRRAHQGVVGLTVQTLAVQPKTRRPALAQHRDLRVQLLALVLREVGERRVVDLLDFDREQPSLEQIRIEGEKPVVEVRIARVFIRLKPDPRFRAIHRLGEQQQIEGVLERAQRTIHFPHGRGRRARAEGKVVLDLRRRLHPHELVHRLPQRAREPLLQQAPEARVYVPRFRVPIDRRDLQPEKQNLVAPALFDREEPREVGRVPLVSGIQRDLQPGPQRAELFERVEHPPHRLGRRTLRRPEHETRARRVGRRPDLEHQERPERRGSRPHQSPQQFRHLPVFTPPRDQVRRLRRDQPRGAGIGACRRFPIDEEKWQPPVDVQYATVRQRVPNSFVALDPVDHQVAGRRCVVSIDHAPSRQCTGCTGMPSSPPAHHPRAGLQGFRRGVEPPGCSSRRPRCNPCLRRAHRTRYRPVQLRSGSRSRARRKGWRAQTER